MTAGRQAILEHLLANLTDERKEALRIVVSNASPLTAVAAAYRELGLYGQGMLLTLLFNALCVTYYHNLLLVSGTEPLITVGTAGLLGLGFSLLWPLELIGLISASLIGFVYLFQFCFDVIGTMGSI